MPGFLSPGKGMPLLLIPEYSGINKGQRIPDKSKTAHKKPPVKCFLTTRQQINAQNSPSQLQQYVDHELSDVQAGFRKGRETRDQIANIHWIIEKAKEFQKNIYFCFIDFAKAFDCVDPTNCGKLEEMGMPDHLTFLLRNLNAGQEATVRTEHGTTDWFQIGKGVRQGCILSPCLFNFYAVYIM